MSYFGCFDNDSKKIIEDNNNLFDIFSKRFNIDILDISQYEIIHKKLKY
jgi:hypothetical protein